MNISIIIPTYNKSIYLNMVLFSIVNNIKLKKGEIIIVDDGSTDNTRQVVEYYKRKLVIQYVYQKKQGLSVARNNGIKCASYDLILFLDDDRVLERDYLSGIGYEDISDVTIGRRREIYYSNFKEIVKYFEQELLNDFVNIKDKIRLERYYKKTLPLFSLKECYIPWIACTFSNTLVKRNIFDKTGFFDEGFTGWGFEDLELAYRIYNVGAEFECNDKMSSIHIYHTHSNELFRQREINYQRFCEKHKNREVFLYKKFMENRITVCQYNEIVKMEKLRE